MRETCIAACDRYGSYISQELATEVYLCRKCV